MNVLRSDDAGFPTLVTFEGDFMPWATRYLGTVVTANGVRKLLIHITTGDMAVATLEWGDNPRHGIYTEFKAEDLTRPAIPAEVIIDETRTLYIRKGRVYIFDAEQHEQIYLCDVTNAETLERLVAILKGTPC